MGENCIYNIFIELNYVMMISHCLELWSANAVRPQPPARGCSIGPLLRCAHAPLELMTCRMLIGRFNSLLAPSLHTLQ